MSDDSYPKNIDYDQKSAEMDNEVIAFLNNRSNAREAARVTTYRVFIGSAAVTVNVHDYGENASSDRYAVEAYLSDLAPEERHGGSRGYSFGHTDQKLSRALLSVHWSEIHDVAME